MAKPSRPEPHPRKSQPVAEESCAEPSTERMAHRPGNADLRPVLRVGAGTAARRAAAARTQLSGGLPSRRVPLKGRAARRPGNADLRPVLRVGAGTAARRAAAARTQLSGGLPSRRVPLEGTMARDSGPPPGELATGLRPASRGSAKPAAMTPGPANVSATPHFSCGRVNGPTRS